MSRVLHIITRPNDPLATEVIARQKAERTVDVIDLTKPEPNYDQLLEAIFKADSVQVW